MAERSKTGYVTAFPFEVKKPKSDIVGLDGNKHDHQLWNLRAAYDTTVALREQFLRAKDELDRRLAEGDLGPKGHATHLTALRDDYHKRLDDGPRKAVEAGRKYGASIVLSSPPDRADETRPMTKAEYRAELARGRAVDRFSQLDPSARRNAIRVASEKQDFGFLQMLLDEPALLDAQTAKAIEMDIARNSQPYAFQCWQDLNGKVTGSGTEPDPLTGALPVLAFVVDNTAEWIDEQAGTESTMAERLAAQAHSGGTDNNSGGTA